MSGAIPHSEISPGAHSVRPLGMTADYARQLLDSLGDAQTPLPEAEFLHPAVTWARSGLMSLTGRSRAEMCPAPIAACADGALLALQSLAPHNPELACLHGSRLLSERAAFMRLSRQGRIAAGGSCRLLDTADGQVAVNLARDEDWAMLPAWLESETLSGEAGEWEALAKVLATRQTQETVERARQLGLPVAASQWPQSGGQWFSITMRGIPRIRRAVPLVLDLSTLWAGPLCGHLLQMLGARVIKVESASRPDAARRGNEDFFDLLNAGKTAVSLDLETETGRAQLLQLIRQADIVIESARPRGLQQMGIVAEDLVRECAGLTWISITGYGRDEDAGLQVAFGDDAGVAAGLSALMLEVTGEAMFVGDAIADPLTGLHAALAAWHSFTHGGGRLISVPLRDVAMHCASFDLPDSRQALKQRHADWTQCIQPDDIQPPVRRVATAQAEPFGADTQNILTEFGLLDA